MRQSLFESWNSLKKEKVSWTKYRNTNYAINIFLTKLFACYPHVSLGNRSKGVYLLIPFMLSVSFIILFGPLTFNFTSNSVCFHFSRLYCLICCSGLGAAACVVFIYDSYYIYYDWLWTFMGCGVYRRFGLIVYSW